ncbi:MAG TPA: alpha/beta fold hydrolase [Candidatus Limnocylindria bacterium]|nr:alpha/beta fold hydrolase [Candidatus Limnocylindria bacterium]
MTAIGSAVQTQAVTFRSEGETLSATLYGSLPARRAAILVHGTNWDASGWAEVAPKFVARGIPALAIDMRGKGRSTGTTREYVPGQPWSPVADVAAAKAFAREHGATEIALVGASLGGHAVLASSFERDNECLVSISAPVAPVPDELSRRVHGRKLYVCAQEDADGAFPNVLASFAALAEPKQLAVFGGTAHSRRMFTEPYADDMLDLVVSFVAKGR